MDCIDRYLDVIGFIFLEIKGGKELTGSPTATLSRAILFVPARRFTGPVYLNLLSSRVPKAEPVFNHIYHVSFG